MRNLIKILAASVTLLFMLSFIDKKSDEFVRTYGVSASDPAQIKLTINSDHSFYYQDFSVATKKIAVKGTWTLKGKKVILKSSDSKTKFHNVWTFADDGRIAKSRKGLTYYRLCKTDR